MQDAPDLFVDLSGVNPEVTFAAGGAEEVIVQVEEDARADASADLSTATARAAIAAVAYKVARTKTALDDMGKNHVADLKQRAKEVDNERKSIRDRLDVLRDTVRKPLTDWEGVENTRIEEHQQALAEIDGATLFDAAEPSTADIQDRLDRLERIGGNRDWQEFEKRAAASRTDALARLATMLMAAKRREAERAELEALRQQQAERDRKAEIAQEAERLASRQQLEAKADAAAANRRAEQAEASAAAEITAANQRAENAAARARQEIAEEQAEEQRIAADRSRNREHRAKINAAARDALCAKAGLAPELATKVVIAMARGEIDYVLLQY